MGSRHHLAAALLLAAAVLGRSALAGGSDPAPAPKPSPTPKPSPRPRSLQPVNVSIARAVDEVLKAHEHPCERAEREGVPCFPVTVETEGPRFSVAEGLRRYRPVGGRPAPGGPPTTAEVQKYLTGAPRSDSGGVSFDPGCAMKSLVRTIRGGGNTFYLYRIQDSRGVRPLLTDRKLSREALHARPEVRELLGEFLGECDAIAAWRKALREDVAAQQAAEEAKTQAPAPKPVPPAASGDPP